ncbi:hypothetical protein BH09PAT4_BH09PAT4_05230 [soil metagenome]
MSRTRFQAGDTYAPFPRRTDRKRLSIDMVGFPPAGERLNESFGTAEEQDERTVQAIRMAVGAGQLAVGQYATPHTRQSAEVAAQVIQAGLAECLTPITDEQISSLKAVAVMAAQESLGQYRVPHTRQSAAAAATEMLAYNGYNDQNQGRGEQ